MGTFEQTFNRIKVKDTIALAEDFSVKRKQIPMSLAEHEAVQRASHVEQFNLRPAIAGDIASGTGDAVTRYNSDFIVAGTNMTTALATFDGDGGVTLTTAGADNDQCILSARTGSRLINLNWNTAKKLRFAATISMGTVSYLDAIAVGFKLTNAADTTTDNDQCMFWVSNGTATTGSVECVYSIAGTDVSVTPTDNSVMNNGFAVNTDYDLLIEIDSSRVPRFYLDGDLVATGTALTALATFEPFVILESGTGAARDIDIRYLSVSRDI